MKLQNEEKAIATIMTMAVQSLDPTRFETLEEIIDQLCKTRSANIDEKTLSDEYEAIGRTRTD